MNSIQCSVFSDQKGLFKVVIASEAKQSSLFVALDCFASLAMTNCEGN